MIINQRIDLDENRTDAKTLGPSANKTADNDFTSSTMDFRKLMAMIGAFYWLIMTVLIVPTGCVCSLFFIIYPLMAMAWIFRLRLSFVNHVEHFLCRMVNDHWVASGQFMGLSVTEYGDDIKKVADKRGLFLCNHLGLADHFALMTAFYDKNSLPGAYLWVIFNIWKFTPLGFMWMAHGNFFINGGAERRQNVLKELQEHLRSIYVKNEYRFVVLYPEAKNGLSPFKHCVHPRAGAAHAVLSVCGPSLKDETKTVDGHPPMEYIIDATLGYPKGNVVDLGSAMLGEWPNGNTNVAVHYKIHKIRPEWQDEEKLKDWLYKRYEEKIPWVYRNFLQTNKQVKPKMLKCMETKKNSCYVMVYFNPDISNQVERIPIPVVDQVRKEVEAPKEFNYITCNRIRFDLPYTSNLEPPVCCCSNYYDDNGVLKTEPHEGTLIRECSDAHCPLRFFNQGIRFKLEVYFNDEKNMWAVRSKQRIPKRVFISEYVGEMWDITHGEKHVYANNNKPIDDYFFQLDTMEHEYGDCRSWLIDAYQCGNVSRFINHSCTANVFSLRARVGNEPYLRVGFYSFRDIAEGEELTINYGDCWWQQKIKEFYCNCSESECKYAFDTCN
ncbi:Acl-12 [Aphelenchoides besseyi]|nr:Acl-12 [Aphelenchoides besseyi]